MLSTVTISERTPEQIAYDDGVQEWKSLMAKEICFKMIDGYMILLGIFIIIAIYNYYLF